MCAERQLYTYMCICIHIDVTNRVYTHWSCDKHRHREYPHNVGTIDGGFPQNVVTSAEDIRKCGDLISQFVEIVFCGEVVTKQNRTTP